MFLCTKDTPWAPAVKERPIRHADAYEVGGQQDGWPGGDIVSYRCPHCGHEWEQELPQ